MQRDPRVRLLYMKKDRSDWFVIWALAGNPPLPPDSTWKLVGRLA